VTNAEDVNFGSASYPAARESLTEDVNAAIRGLLIGGASEVVLTDGHGSGNPEPDYLLDRLPKGARFDIRPRPYDPYIESVDTTYAAVVAIGMHGRAAGSGFLAHTFTGSTRWVAAGHEMNESMILAASAARFDIPLILVTGDDVLHKELAEFTPKTRYVVVKRAVSTTEAAPRPRAQVTAEIEAEAARAVRNIADVPHWRPAGFEAPFTNEFGYTMPEQASIAIRYPGAESMNDKTIRLRSDSFVDAYLAFRALAGFTALVRPTLMLQSLQQVDGGPEVLQKLQQRFPRPAPTFEPTGPEVRPIFGPGRHGVK
jgi:D-amino peptidase